MAIIVEKVIGNVNTDKYTKTPVRIPFEWFELEKKRLKKTAENGTEIGFAVGEPFEDGDIVAEDESSIYVIDVLPVKLTEIQVDSMLEMGRVCFELGNRHLSPQIEEHSVRVVYDEPTYLFLKKMCFEVGIIEDKFTNFIVCKAHEHSHSHHC